jgi:DNA-binding transcriptional ArsR family regulator
VASLTSRDWDRVFLALGHRHRRNIIDALRLAPRTVNFIAESLSLSAASTSKHLTVLTWAGLVHHTRRGRRQWYHLQCEPLDAVCTWLAYTSASRPAQKTVYPPSATRTEPVMKLEASLARKTIAGASSSTVP